MEEDDYYVDRYDCPATMMANNHHDDDRTTGSQPTSVVDCGGGSTSPQSLDIIVPRIGAGGSVDDEPYEYDDDYDHQLYTPASQDADPAAGAEEYLREIWSQLNVGHQGYLTMSELQLVCEHIGMSVANDHMVVEQLFEKLDNDQDGRVSFCEFVDGLFKYVHHRYDHQPGDDDPADGQRQQQPRTTTTTIASSTIASNQNEPTKCPVRATFNNAIATTTTTTTVQQQSSTTTNGVHNHRHHEPHHHHQQQTIKLNGLLSTYTSFITIKSDKDGYTDATTLIDLWDSLGFNQEEDPDMMEPPLKEANNNHDDPNNNVTTTTNNKSSIARSSNNNKRILKYFGYNSNNSYIASKELWTKMEDLLVQHCDEESYQVSLATILNEFAQLKFQYDQILAKSERLELQLQQANGRAEFLAQEVDEQHNRLEKSSQTKLALLEKKYRDQIRLIEMDFQHEKELMINQNCHLRQDIDRQMNSVQDQLSKFRLNIKMLEEENERLESECQLMKYQNSELTKNLVDMQKQVQESDHLHAKIAELESIECAEDRKNMEHLATEMERLKQQNKKLQDQNDELLIEKESLRQQLASFILGYQQQQQQQTNQSSIFLSSSTISMESSNGGGVGGGGSSKKRKRRRRKNKHKNKQNKMAANVSDQQNNDVPVESVHRDQNEHQTTTTTKQHHQVSPDKATVPTHKSSTSATTIQTDTNTRQENELNPPSKLADDSFRKSTQNTEDDQSSIFTITTQGDDFDDDYDYEEYDHHLESSLHFWTQRKRLKQPKLSDKMSVQEEIEEEEEENDENDVDDDDEDGTRVLMPNHHANPTTTHGICLSDEINFDRSRPVYANNNGHRNSSSLESSLNTIINQIVMDCDQPKEDAAEMLRKTLSQIQQALQKVEQTTTSTTNHQAEILAERITKQVYFDHNNNPNP